MNSSKQRNYQIDVLKFLLALFVFLSHTWSFVGENTTFLTADYLGQYGWWSVFCFFNISGLLMINSLFNVNPDVSQRGRTALYYVLNKFKRISLEYWLALFIFVIVCVICGESDMLTKISRIVPEIFCLNQAGFRTGEFNTSQWYLSAMLLSMIPLSYLLIRNKDLYTHIFAPISAFLGYAYLFNYETSPTPGQYVFNGYLYLGIIMAIMGLCFGDIAWLISQKLKQTIKSKQEKFFITFLEIFLYAVIFINWILNINDRITAYSINLLFPIALGISFSQKSYICEFFKKEIFNRISTFSLALYLNHMAARKIVLTFFDGRSYKESTILMFAFTIGLILIFFAMLKLLKLAVRCLINKKRV